MSKNAINIEEIKLKLIGKLRESGWSTFLRMFFQSSDFDDILNFLLKERNEGNRFTPSLKQVFNAFEKCSIVKLKVVIINATPHGYFGAADGMAFSCSNTMKPLPVLKVIQQAVNNDVEHNPDLTRWAEQGVLLLNTALTCQIDKPESHIKLWKEFIAYVMDILNHHPIKLIFVLIGKQPQDLESLIDEDKKHVVIKLPDPALINPSNNNWEFEDVFNHINRILKEDKKDEIIW